MRTSTTIAIALLMFGTGCGARSAPTGDNVRDSGQVADSATRRDIMVARDAVVFPPRDGCVRPPTLGCESSDECALGSYCGGCYRDPCCPECSACYAMCAPGCLENTHCPPGEYCHADSCTPDQDRPGSCVPPPADCWDDYDPVCGCDERTHPNACHAQAQAVNIAYVGECQQDDLCRGVSCVVGNDCCVCDAFYADDEREICDMDCFINTCESWNFRAPAAYCLQGRCFITDERRSCSADSDCRLHNDCCRCAALHNSIKPPACASTCFAPSCLAEGVPTAGAACIYGVCKLVVQ